MPNLIFCSSQNLDKGWKTIESVMDMDPPEPFGRYFGCNHFEKTQVKLPRSAHPFAYVFDKKTAAPARGDPRPQVREDYWEDTELGAVVRHHVYPRKRLCTPPTVTLSFSRTSPQPEALR